MNLPTEIFGDVIVVHTPEELGADQCDALEAYVPTLERQNVVLDLDATETHRQQGADRPVERPGQAPRRAAARPRSPPPTSTTARFSKSPASTSNWKCSTAWSTP